MPQIVDEIPNDVPNNEDQVVAEPQPTDNRIRRLLQHLSSQTLEAAIDLVTDSRVRQQLFAELMVARDMVDFLDVFVIPESQLRSSIMRDFMDLRLAAAHEKLTPI